MFFFLLPWISICCFLLLFITYVLVLYDLHLLFVNGPTIKWNRGVGLGFKKKYALTDRKKKIIILHCSWNKQIILSPEKCISVLHDAGGGEWKSELPLLLPQDKKMVFCLIPFYFNMNSNNVMDGFYFKNSFFRLYLIFHIIATWHM